MAAIKGNGVSGKNFSQQNPKRLFTCSDQEVYMIIEKNPGVT
jgi:hypothetical protein